jgi:hypothetical protein
MLPTAIETSDEEMIAVVKVAEEQPTFAALGEELPAPVAPADEAALLGDPFGDVALGGYDVSGDVFQLQPPAPPPPPTKVPELEFAAEAPALLELSQEAKGALVQRVIPRALAQVGEVRELELEVPVPAVWTGGKRLTLQLRLTLVPEEDIDAE